MAKPRTRRRSGATGHAEKTASARMLPAVANHFAGFDYFAAHPVAAVAIRRPAKPLASR